MDSSDSRRGLVIRGRDVQSGEVVRVSPNTTDWRYISFRVVRLASAEQLSAGTGDDECALVVISGSVSATTSEGDWPAIGQRDDPFCGQPEVLFLPASTTYEISALRDAEVAICSAPARERHPARLIAVSAAAEYTRGEGNAQRRIRNIMMGEDESSALFSPKSSRRPETGRVTHRTNTMWMTRRQSLCSKSSTIIARIPRQVSRSSVSTQRPAISTRR